ncbi:MAG: PDZ domain-containing protein [Caulobacterales bacterium]|nr:PDZ domain-containing protein [Caulobacterales bacterium]
MRSSGSKVFIAAVIWAVLAAGATAARGEGASLGMGLADVAGSGVTSNGRSLTHGVIVTRLREGGAAERAGLRTGDIITRAPDIARDFEVRLITNTADIVSILAGHQPGDMIFFDTLVLADPGADADTRRRRYFVLELDDGHGEASSYRIVNPTLQFHRRGERQGLTDAYKSWQSGAKRSDRFRELVAGDSAGETDPAIVGGGRISFDRLSVIRTQPYFEILIDQARCRAGYDRMDVFIRMADAADLDVQASALGGMLDYAAGHALGVCGDRTVREAVARVVTRDGDVRRIYHISRRDFSHHPVRVDSPNELPELATKGRFGAMLHNLSVGDLDTIELDSGGAKHLANIYYYFGRRYGKQCIDTLDEEEVTTLILQEYEGDRPVGDPQTRVVEARIAEKMQEYFGYISGLSSAWVRDEVLDLFLAHDCRSSTIQNVRESLYRYGLSH